MARARLVQAGATTFHAASDGTLAYTLPAPAKASFVWTDRAGATSPVPGATVEITLPDFALSPDGRRAAFVVGSQPIANMVVRDLATGADTPLTFNRADAPRSVWTEIHAPRWFPGGDRVLYVTGRY